MSDLFLLGFFGFPGHIELLIVAFVILLLFGHRLPSLMRSLGRGVVEFKQGLSGTADEDEFDEEDVPRKKKTVDGNVQETVSEK